MSFLDRLQFWRKNDEYSFDSSLPPDLGTTPSNTYETPSAGGLPELGESSFDKPSSYDKPSSFEKPSYGTPLGFEKPMNMASSSPNRDLEIISLKLDAIKAELDAINQRLVRVEKLAELNIKGGKATSRDIWATY